MAKSAAATVADFLSSRGARPGRPAAASTAPLLPDLSALTPAPSPAPVPLRSSPLDLPSVATPKGPATRSAGRSLVRATPKTQKILTSRAPAVTLTRIQSGIGTLTLEAACPPSVGDLRLGCAYQLRGGRSSTVTPSGQLQIAPPQSKQPVLIGHRDAFEKITVDLRQSRDLERLILFGYSESGAVLRWGGTLLATTFGGARIAVPLDRPPMPGVMVFLSLYNVDGEFGLRAEMDIAGGTVREACTAYGYDRISWLDDRTVLPEPGYRWQANGL
jgi:hypothetical protein